MITLLLMSAIYQLFAIMINPLLPVANPDIIDKLSSTFSYIIDKFLVLGYYYLPMDTVKTVVSTVISVYIISFAIKFGLKIFPVLSGGAIKTDNL